MQNGKRTKAGYHHVGGVLPFALRDQGRFVRTWSSPYMTHWGQSLCTSVHSPYARTQENEQVLAYRGGLSVGSMIYSAQHNSCRQMQF